MTEEFKDWQTVNQQLIEDQRRRLGEPPTAEQVLAYLRGELSSAEEERMRDLLVAYPDLARPLTVTFPEEEAAIPDDRVAEQWEALQQRLLARQNVVPFHRGRWIAAVSSMAAALVVVIGLAWRKDTQLDQLSKPRVAAEQLLTPDGRRGPAGEAPTLEDGDPVVLTVPLYNAPAYESFSIELLSGHNVVWSSGRLAPPEVEEAYRVVVPRAFVQPGTLKVIVHATRAGREDLTSYTLHVPAR